MDSYARTREEKHMSLLIVVVGKGLKEAPEKLRAFRAGVLDRVLAMLRQSGEEVVGTARED
jgi:hypothetical protein